MMNRHNKGRLLIFFTLIAFLSAWGGSATTKTGMIPTTFKKTFVTGNHGRLDQQLIATAQATTPTVTSTPTVAPTPTPPPPTTLPNYPASGGAFITLGPGSQLPSDAECAARVQHTSWEPRSENATANHTNVYAQGYRLTGSDLAQYGYQGRVTGNFTGTIDVNIARAQAIQESHWRQSTLGDCRGGTVPETNGCQSVGILQVKAANIPATHPGTWPYAAESTAFNADYAYAVWRACFEGKETWLENGYHAGDTWGCVGRWFSGDWYGGSQDYISSVQGYLGNKDWLQPAF